MNNVSSHTDEWTPPPLDIPPQWEQIDFEDAFENISLARFKVPQKEYLSSGMIPIVDQGVSLIGGYTNDASKGIQPNGALIVFGDHTQCFKLIDFRFAPGADGVKVLKPITINERFAYYACRALRLPNRGYSRHYAFLKKSKLPLAPLVEQRRIVAKIEKLFSELDKGIERLKTARTQLATYRQAVLKHAFEGKLTAQWREANKGKLETREQLLARIKQERASRYERQLQEWKTAVKEWEGGDKGSRKPRKPRAPNWTPNFSKDLAAERNELPFGWTWAQIESIFDVVSGGTPKGLEQAKVGDIPFYKVSDMNTPGNQTRMHAAAIYLSELQTNELGLTAYPEGTVIFPKRGGAILTNKKRILSRPSCFDLNTMGVVNSLASILNEYLWNWFQSLDLSTIYDGSNVPQINNKNVEPLLFPICSIEEQREIASILEKTLALVDETEADISQELQKADKLRQSVLKKAFAGQLVAQDLSDEPASVLLDRIKAVKDQARKNGETTEKTRTMRTVV